MKPINFNFDFVGWMAFSLTHDGVQYDLHSHGLFEGFHYNILDHSLLMSWLVDRYRAGELVPYAVTPLSLKFTNVERFQVTIRDPEMPSNEDECLDFITYTEPTEDLFGYKIDDPIPSLSSRSTPDESKDLIFKFWGGQLIRIGADSVVLTIS